MAFDPQSKHIRFYNDDGSASTATAAAAEDANVNVTPGSDKAFQFRVQVQEAGGTNGNSTDGYRLQYSKNGGAWTNVTTSSSNVKAFDSANFSGTGDGNLATSDFKLTAGTGSAITGKFSQDGTANTLQLTANNYTELLFCVQTVDADLAVGDTIDLRVALVTATVVALSSYLVTPRITKASAVQTLTPSLFSNSQSFFSPAVSSSYALTPGLLSNGQSFFSATVHATKSLTPGLLSNSQTFYGPTVHTGQAIGPDLFTNISSFYSAAVLEIQTLQPELFDNGAIATPQTLLPTSIVSSANMSGAVVSSVNADDATYATWISGSGGNPQIRVGFDVPPGPLKSGAGLQTFTAKVRKSASSPVTLTANLRLLESGSGTVLATASTSVSSNTADTTLTLTWDTSLLSDKSGAGVEAEVVGNWAASGGLAGVNVGYIKWDAELTNFPAASITLNVAPSLYTNNQSLFSPTAHATAALAPQLHINSPSFFSAVAAAGPVSLLPVRFDNSQNFLVVTTSSSYHLQPSLLTNNNSFFDPTAVAFWNIRPSLLSAGQTFYSPVLNHGQVILQPGLLTNAQAFPGPTAAASYALLPPLLSAGQAFPAAAITSRYSLLAPLFSNSPIFPSATISGFFSLRPLLLASQLAFYSPHVFISLNAAPGSYADVQLLWLREVRPEVLLAATKPQTGYFVAAVQPVMIGPVDPETGHIDAPSPPVHNDSRF